jgi:hypothetical protein
VLPCPTDPSGILSVLLPPISIASERAAVRVVSGPHSTARWIGVDRNERTTRHSTIVLVRLTRAGSTTTAYNPPTISLNKNLMIRLQ